MRKKTLIFSLKNSPLLLLIMASIVFACSSTENTPSKENSIGFRSLVESTRIGEMTTENVKNFMVSAIWTKAPNTYEQNFMNKVLVERQDSDWAYSPSRYWPSSGTIDFYAYSPGESSGVKSFTIVDYNDTTTPHDVAIEYDVTTDVLMQEDFLVATALEKTGADGTVLLNFDHVLSYITFELRDEKYYRISVRDITMFNLKREGILKGTITDTKTMDWKWTDASHYENYSISIKNEIAIITTHTSCGGMMILPQKVSSGSGALDGFGYPTDIGSGKFYLSITYTYDGSSSRQIKTTYIPLTVGGSKDFEFEKGKKYIIKADLDPSTTRSLSRSSSQQATTETIASVEVVDTKH